MKTQVMLFVRDVQDSSAWYQALLGARSAHGGSEYEMLTDEAGELLFQLHKLNGSEHGVNLNDDSIPRGAGVLCYVNVEDVEQIYKRALAVGAEVEGEPRFVKAAGHTEFIVKDPDGYSLAIYSRGTTG
ncbi:MAG: VOC family protein [Proteobacteria bacterium]|nr:VOC family protein [Pseudomonadota bacterium]